MESETIHLRSRVRVGERSREGNWGGGRSCVPFDAQVSNMLKNAIGEFRFQQRQTAFIASFKSSRISAINA